MRTAPSAGRRDLAPEPVAPAASAPPTPTLEPVAPPRLLLTGALPRTRPRRALLCSSTPPQFVEMLRVGRFLKAGDEFEAVFWIQMLPHKLADATALCDREGFPYMAHPLGTPAAGTAATQFGVQGPGPLPFVRESWRAAVSQPLEAGRWLQMATAVVGRSWRRVVARWVHFCRAHEPVRATRLVRRGLGALSRAASRLGGGPGLPRPLRPMALLFFMGLFLVFDRNALINLATMLAGYRARNRSARATLASLRPDLIVVAEDSLYDYASFIAEGWWRGIPTVVVPYTISTAAEPAETILGSPELHTHYTLETWPARLVARLFPHWVHVYKGHTLLRLSSSLVLVLEYLRLAPPRPWLFNSGYSVALAAESEHMAALYLKEGLDPDYVVLTGALYDDDAAAVATDRAGRRRALLHETGLPPRRSLVVCALPPRMEIDRRAGCEFASHEEIVEFMLAPLLSLPDTAVVVSLHPTLRAPDMRYVERWGARVASWNVADLIACSDLFVASISATIRIAIAGGVPVVNFDVFRYGYRDYENVPGTVTVATRAEYAATLARIRADPTYLEALRRGQERIAARWGFRDGRSGQAILDLFKHVIAHKTPRGYASPHGRLRT